MPRQSLTAVEPVFHDDASPTVDAKLVCATIVHDFNNLLTPIVSIMTELQRQRVGTPRQLARIDGALFCAFKATALARQLLDVAEFGRFERQAITVTCLVAPLEAALAGIMPASTHCTFDLPDDLPAVLIDRSLMERVLINLAINARDAMPSGGQFSISASLCEPIEKALPMLRLCVTDNGQGMPEHLVRQVSQARFSTKPNGTGLGLQMVRNVVERQGGDLRIESSPGKGTTVELRLPLAPPSCPN
jgi:signal transduction histidine kinase